MTKLNRRETLELCISRGLLLGSLSQQQLLSAYQAAESAALKPTSAEVLGPFYRKGAPSQPNLRAPGDAGFPLKVTGRVLNTKAQLVEGATVDLWPADQHGRYDTRGYKYRAKLAPDPKGVYSVDTVMPGHYADRPAQHIHYLITAPGHKPLITQAYFATDPFFEGNPEKNWKKQGIAENRELILPVRLYEGGATSADPARAEITFDIILERA